MRTILLCTAACGVLFAAQSTSDRAWEVLEKGLTSKSPISRVRAVYALGAVNHDASAQAEAERLLNDSDAKVRAAAALALGNMDARSSADRIAALFDNPSFEEAFAAASTLRRFDDPRAYRVYYATLTGQKKTGEGLIESQMKILRDPKALAKMGFTHGIGFVPYAGQALTAYGMITQDDISPIREEAALRLAHDPDPRSAKALTNALADKKWVVRAAAAEAIGQRNDPALMGALPALFSDEEDVVRYASAAAYLRLTSPDIDQATSGQEFAHRREKWTRDEELLHRLSKFLRFF